MKPNSDLAFLPSAVMHCTCPAGVIRLCTFRPLSVGVWCPACERTTLRNEQEIHRFLDVYEGDEDVRRCVINALYEHTRLEELSQMMETPKAPLELESLPFEIIA